jgi:hypothetical protein
MNHPIDLIQAELEYRAGNPRPLAEYIRRLGLPAGPPSDFVASIIEGTFKRDKHDTHYLRELDKLSLLRAAILRYTVERRIRKEQPEYVGHFKNLDEVRAFVAETFHTTPDSIAKLELRARKRKVSLKSRDK